MVFYSAASGTPLIYPFDGAKCRDIPLKFQKVKLNKGNLEKYLFILLI